MKMRAVIVDDSENDIRLLEMELKPFDIVVTNSYSDSKKFLTEESGLNYDVLFLDYNMPNLQGGDIIVLIKKPIILVTGESRDYSEKINDLKLDHKHFICTLNKPVNAVRLHKAIELLASKRPLLTHLQVNTYDGKQLIAVSEIDIISSNDIESSKSLGEGKNIYMKSKSPIFVPKLVLEDVYRKLDSDKFLLAGRSDIVNLSCITKITHDSIEVIYTGKDLKLKTAERTLNKQGKDRLDQISK